MPKADNSTAILTGMIIAALYVILLVGFTQESYMRCDAASRADNFSRGAMVDDIAKRICRSESPLCTALFSDAGERQNCMTPIEAVRRTVSASRAPLTLEGVRRAMSDEQ